MIPATHAAVGAAIAAVTPRLWVALPLAFASHFACDAVYHFEAFYPLSRKLGTTHEDAALLTAGALAAIVGPAVLWLARQSRARLALAGYLGVSCLALAIPAAEARLSLHLMVAAFVMWFAASTALQRAVICGFAANLPDLARAAVPLVENIHQWSHYTGPRDLGDVSYRLATGKQSVFVGYRFDEPWYVTGYVVEVAIEIALLLGGFAWARRSLPPARPAAGADQPVTASPAPTSSQLGS